MATTKIQLPTPISGVATGRKTRTRAESFKAWKDALDQAQTAVGYDKDNSRIKGLTRIEVIKESVDMLKTLPAGTCDSVIAVLTELLKRELARVEAGKIYRS